MFTRPLIAALLATLPAAAQTAYQPRIIAAADARADVALLRRGLETIHPGLYRYTPRAAIDAGFRQLEAATAQPISELALHREIALLLARIHCDHTKAEQSDAMTKWRRDNPSHLPLRFQLIEGRMIVTSTDNQPGAPPVGAEVLAINGQAVPALLLQLAPTVAYDGDTDQAVAVKLGDDSDLQGDDFNENYAGLFGMPQAWQLQWKAVGASTPQTATLRPISFARWTQLPAPAGDYRDEFYKSISWRMAGKQARLRIDTFVNYRNPVQTTAFLGGFFRAMKAAGTEHLILDLRGNGGGSEDVSIALGRYLFDAPFTWSKPVRYKAIRYGDLPKYIESWGDTADLFHAPESAFTRTADGWFDRTPIAGDEADDDNSTMAHLPIMADHFAGKLTILTGPQNGSGATRTIAQFKERRGATLVGEDTSGSAEGPTAGQIFLMTLPASGIKVRIPNAWNRTNISHFTPRQGVAADVLVTPTLADYQAGRDRALLVARVAPPAPAAGALAALFDGQWAGTLDYRDYGDDSRAVLPTLLQGRAMVLDFTYDDGPGKTVTSREIWQPDADGAGLTIRSGKDASHFAISEWRQLADGSQTLVLDGKGRDNDRPVLKRLVVTRLGDRLRLTDMSRTPGTPFLLRHALELTLQPRHVALK
jgi:hypothetical protein